MKNLPVQHAINTLEPSKLASALQTASWVLKTGGREAQAVGAILSFVGTVPTGSFGDEVTRIVWAFSDPEVPAEVKLNDWILRKKYLFAKFREIPLDSLHVVFCAELCNVMDAELLVRTLSAEALKARFPEGLMNEAWAFKEVLAIAHHRLGGLEPLKPALLEYSRALRAFQTRAFG